MRQANAKEDGGSIGLDIHLIKILIVYFVTLLLMVDGCCFLSLECKKKKKPLEHKIKVSQKRKVEKSWDCQLWRERESLRPREMKNDTNIIIIKNASATFPCLQTRCTPFVKAKHFALFLLWFENVESFFFFFWFLQCLDESSSLS